MDLFLYKYIKGTYMSMVGGAEGIDTQGIDVHCLRADILKEVWTQVLRLI